MSGRGQCEFCGTAEGPHGPGVCSCVRLPCDCRKCRASRDAIDRLRRNLDETLQRSIGHALRAERAERESATTRARCAALLDAEGIHAVKNEPSGRCWVCELVAAMREDAGAESTGRG